MTTRLSNYNSTLSLPLEDWRVLHNIVMQHFTDLNARFADYDMTATEAAQQERISMALAHVAYEVYEASRKETSR